LRNAEPGIETDSRRSVICAYFVLGFALWTVICHLTVFTEGNLVDLIMAFTSTGFLLLVWEWIRRKRRKSEHPVQTIPAKETEKRAQRVDNILLWVLVGGVVCLTLVAHRPDEDDTRYVNRAVAAADAPYAPVLKYDTRHSIPGLPIERTSKCISNEMLAAALSLVTRLPAIYIFHLVFPPIMAMLTILSYGELFRILAPKHWLGGVLAVVVFLCANGEVHRSYGNFSFVRLHQGKGALVSVIMPLIIAYGLHFALRPTPRHWLLLSSAQIAAIGMSSTGLMLAPIVALLTVLTGVLGLNVVTQVKRIFLGFLASAYVVAMGVYIKFPLFTYMIRIYTQTLPSTRIVSFVRTVPSLPPPQQQFVQNVEYVFGSGRFAILCLLIFLTAWIWCETCVARRLCLVFPIMIGLIFANPFLKGLMVRYITGQAVYWRVFWLLPLPTMAGLTLLAPLTFKLLIPPLRSYKGVTAAHESTPDSSQEGNNSFLRYGLYFLLLVLLLGVVSERNIFSKANRVRLGVPGLKVTPEYQIAKAINDAIADRPNVLAPEPVSLWLPTMHHHPYPLVSRFRYANWLRNQRQERVTLTRYMMGIERPDNAPSFLQEGIQRYQIAAVCIPLSNPWVEEIRSILRTSGFEKRQELLSHEIWIISNQEK
jgi:hypothetical protein